MHQELVKTKKALEIEKEAHQSKERDLLFIKQDTEEIRKSERILREERSRILSEVSMLRDRVRETDDERKRSLHFNRYVNKHYSVSSDDIQNNNNNNNNTKVYGTSVLKDRRITSPTGNSNLFCCIEFLNLIVMTT